VAWLGAGTRSFLRESRAIYWDRRVFLFVALNIADLLLTLTAISMGSHELNIVYTVAGSTTGMAILKLALAATVVTGLTLFRRTYLLTWINAGMAIVVIWNLIATFSWCMA
jgi:hypothetical protein